MALVYADQATLDRQKEIQSLQTQIEQLQYAEEAALGAEVSLRLDAQILQTIRDYRGALAADRLDTAEDCGAELRSLVMKRDYTYSDTEDLSAQMAELRSQLSSLRAQAGSSVRQITAPQAGLYSAVVDGYENILTPESLETLTPRTLAALEPDESLRSNRVGKLVLGDTWYYVTTLEESEAQTLQESGGLKLRFAKGVGRDLSVKLTHVSEAEGGRVVAVFQGDTYLSELTLLRQQSAEVIRQTTTGIRVPKEALRVREQTVTDEDGNESVVSETGVYCMVGMKARFKPVDVLYSGDDFALVRSTRRRCRGGRNREPGAPMRCPALSRQSSNDEPAVGGEDLPREEGGLVRGQKGNGVGHVLRRPQPPQRRLLRQIPQGLLSQDLNHIGVDDAGSHAVDPDVGGRQLQRQGPGQPHESGFGAGIRHLAGGSPQSPDG